MRHKNGHNTHRNHGYHLKKSKYIYKLILQQEKDGDQHVLSPTNVVDYLFGDADDTKMAQYAIDLMTEADYKVLDIIE